MMRISCHAQQRFIEVGPWCTKANASLGEGQQQQRTPKLVDGECKVRNERQLSKKLKSSNAEQEGRNKRMEDE